MSQIKKVLSFVLILFCIFLHENRTFATSIIVPPTITSNISTELPAKYLDVREFVKLSARDFSKLSGIKLNFFQKISFGITKLRLKQDLKKNPDLKITDYHSIAETGRKFNFLWFLFGLAGPAIGLATGSLIVFGLVAIAPIVITYLVNKDKSKINSTWLGFGSGVLLILLLGTLALISLRNF